MPLGQRVAVVLDDDRLLAALIASQLEENGFECHVAHTVGEARALLKSYDVDVAIIDIHLANGPSGIQVAKAAEKAHPGVGIVFLTNTPDYISLEVSPSDLPQHFGVAGKDSLASGDDLLDALESVLVSSREPIRHDVTMSPSFATLTKSQREILKDVAMGLTNQAIADKRNITKRSVERSLQNVFDKLDIADNPTTNRRATAIRRYVEALGLPPAHG